MRPRNSTGDVLIALIAASAAGLALASPAAAAAKPARVRVPNAQPSMSRATAHGRTSTTQSIDVRLYLAGRDPSGMLDQVQAISTPGSSSYGDYLSPAQVRAKYAPADDTLASVTSFLADNGLKVTSMPANRLYVETSGSVAQMQKAFATTLEDYTVGGRTIRAASSAPTVPADLADTVTAVSGLASESQLMTPNHEDAPATSSSSRSAPGSTTKAPPPDAFVNARPCSTYYGEKVATSTPPAYGTVQPYAPCGYIPAQLQGTYGLRSSIAKGRDGRGVTVAITDAYAAPTIVQDAARYATSHGQKALTSSQFTQVTPKKGYRYGYDDTKNGDQCGEQGWYGEETLDVEAVHAVAPGANITYVASRSCDNGDFADTLNKVVDQKLADIVTNSWGGTDESNGSTALDAAYNRVFAQAALEGIGMYFSSGDSGDGAATNNGTPTTQAPANSPLVTAVGGTSLAVGADNQRLWETGWSTARSALTDGAWTPAPPGTYQYGAGGGTSRVFQQPWYQKGVVPSSLANRYDPAVPARVVPDVSAIADPNTGMLVGETQTFPDGTARYSEYRIGGTSLASPVFAGIMAIADQIAGRPHGFANPVLYRAAGTKAYYDPQPLANRAVVRVDYANAVNDSDGLLTSLRSIDVTTGTILRARTGYDDVTGVGSVNGPAFFAAVS